MIYFENIFFISLLQIIPSSIIFFIIWNTFDDYFYRSVLSTLGFSSWIIFNSICIRKTRYNSNHLVICGNYRNRSNFVASEMNMVVNNEKKISVFKLIIILLPTILCNMFVLLIFYWGTILFIRFTNIWIINIIIACILTLLLTGIIFFIGTEGMDWNRQLVSAQYGFSNSGIIGIMFMDLKLSIYNLFIIICIMFFMSSLPVIFGCLFHDDRKINNNTINQSLNNSVTTINNQQDITRYNNDKECNGGIRENRSIDNLIQYGSM